MSLLLSYSRTIYKSSKVIAGAAARYLKIKKGRGRKSGWWRGGGVGGVRRIKYGGDYQWAERGKEM